MLSSADEQFKRTKFDEKSEEKIVASSYTKNLTRMSVSANEGKTWGKSEKQNRESEVYKINLAIKPLLKVEIYMISIVSICEKFRFKLETVDKPGTIKAIKNGINLVNFKYIHNEFIEMDRIKEVVARQLADYGFKTNEIQQYQLYCIIKLMKDYYENVDNSRVTGAIDENEKNYILKHIAAYLCHLNDVASLKLLLHGKIINIDNELCWEAFSSQQPAVVQLFLDNYELSKEIIIEIFKELYNNMETEGLAEDYDFPACLRLLIKRYPEIIFKPKFPENVLHEIKYSLDDIFPNILLVSESLAEDYEKKCNEIKQLEGRIYKLETPSLPTQKLLIEENGKELRTDTTSLSSSDEENPALENFEQGENMLKETDSKFEKSDPESEESDSKSEECSLESEDESKSEESSSEFESKTKSDQSEEKTEKEEKLSFCGELSTIFASLKIEKPEDKSDVPREVKNSL